MQGGHEHLLDVGPKRLGVDRAVEDRRGAHAVEPERRDDRVGLPVPAGRMVVHACAPAAAPIATQEIRRHAAFIEKHVVPDVAERLPVPPVAAGRGYVRPALFVGVYRFF